MPRSQEGEPVDEDGMTTAQRDKVWKRFEAGDVSYDEALGQVLGEERAARIIGIRESRRIIESAQKNTEVEDKTAAARREQFDRAFRETSPELEIPDQNET